ncbi:MAG: protein-tyrosine phosphatase family protein [Thalassovita sp.]
MESFVIHALQLGDGILALAPLPGRNGNYEADLEHLREWQPAIVISMTTEAEMVAHGAHDLGQDLRNSGTRWVHLPVADFGAPGAQVVVQWPEISQAARNALDGGGRVLIHCKGGCGRSGMAALRLMIDAGEPPTEALAHLRRVRPCAVETQAQMDWAITPTPSE